MSDDSVPFIAGHYEALPLNLDSGKAMDVDHINRMAGRQCFRRSAKAKGLVGIIEANGPTV